MKVIFATTSRRKIQDLIDIIEEDNLNLEILTMKDIGWNIGEIEETGKTLQENSLIKAKAVHKYCLEQGIKYPIIADDTGLFVDALKGEPGIYTARYADEERKKDPSLPPYECINKLLKKLGNSQNREAYYQCVVTCIKSDGSYFQETGKSYGNIVKQIEVSLQKPYFYCIFELKGTKKVFQLLSRDELKATYRYVTLRKVLQRIHKEN